MSAIAALELAARDPTSFAVRVASGGLRSREVAERAVVVFVLPVPDHCATMVGRGTILALKR